MSDSGANLHDGLGLKPPVRGLPPIRSPARPASSALDHGDQVARDTDHGQVVGDEG